jgi:hypothetical protein
MIVIPIYHTDSLSACAKDRDNYKLQITKEPLGREGESTPLDIIIHIEDM